MTDIFIILLLFILGLFSGMISVIIGIKLPLKKKTYFNRCDHCDFKYKWYQYIPVISYFMNKCRCPKCNYRYNLWYPFLELMTGVLFSLAFLIYGFSYEMFIFMILAILTVMVFVSDFKYYIILDKPLWVFGVITLILKYIYFGFETFLISITSAALIFLFMLSIRFVANKIFKRDSLGGGDIKLVTFFGVVVAIRLTIISLILGSFLAFPYAIYYALMDKEKEIPFGPFLILGLYTVFLFMEPINTFIAIVFQ